MGTIASSLSLVGGTSFRASDPPQVSTAVIVVLRPVCRPDKFCMGNDEAVILTLPFLPLLPRTYLVLEARESSSDGKCFLRKTLKAEVHPQKMAR